MNGESRQPVAERGSASIAISVAIPTFQRRDALRRLLRALESQTLPATDFEVVVAVDGSTDGTLEMLESYEPPYRLRWTRRSNGGRAAACNAAIREAHGDLLLVLDDDMEPSPRLLEAHVRAHSSGARLCVMGAAPIAIDDEVPPHVRYVAGKFGRHLERLARADHEFRIRDFYSGNASARRSELLGVGLFDEQFQVYGNEDLELAHRLVANGVELSFSPEAISRQHYDKSLRALAEDERAKGGTAVLFAAMHPEALPGMRLTDLRSQGVGQRATRRLMLWGTRAFRRLPDLVLSAVAIWERLAPNRFLVVHRLALDYVYLLGAEEARRGHHGAPAAPTGSG